MQKSRHHRRGFFVHSNIAYRIAFIYMLVTAFLLRADKCYVCKRWKVDDYVAITSRRGKHIFVITHFLFRCRRCFHIRIDIIAEWFVVGFHQRFRYNSLRFANERQKPDVIQIETNIIWIWTRFVGIFCGYLAGENKHDVGRQARIYAFKFRMCLCRRMVSVEQ